jgi:hypothetical protein
MEQFALLRPDRQANEFPADTGHTTEMREAELLRQPDGRTTRGAERWMIEAKGEGGA